jgi:chromosome segregation ATPase
MGELQAASRIVELESQVKELETALASVSEELETTLTSANKERETALAQTTEELEIMKRDYAEVRKSSISQREDRALLDQRICEVQSLLDASQSVVTSLKEAVEEKDLVIATLSQRLIKVSDDNADLASKMMELKNDLIDAQINYQTFDVVKVGRLLNSSAKVRTQQLTIKRNFSGDPVVEWEVRGRKYIFKAEAIDSVYLHPSREDHFMVSILVTSR